MSEKMLPNELRTALASVSSVISLVRRCGYDLRQEGELSPKQYTDFCFELRKRLEKAMIESEE